jgi:hypothetical protein
MCNHIHTTQKSEVMCATCATHNIAHICLHILLLNMLHKIHITLFLRNAVFWDITPCGSCKNDAPLKHRFLQE